MRSYGVNPWCFIKRLPSCGNVESEIFRVLQHYRAESGHKKITPQTLNLAKCQQLLGHKSIANTALYLGIEQREALDLAKKIKV